ncbi:MAG: alpha/beta hydrolase [Hyphomicrobiaceae bacterium]|nr:alpha/beta hydrolase [Hyphomicrobiaceae bacterium]
MTDITLHHTDQGNGAPALFWIHGFSSGLEDWDAQVAHFSPRHRNIAVALRGHGASERGTRDMTIPQLAEDCLAILREKKIDSVVVAGHSMGTRIALELAQQAPEIVKGLILVDGSNTALAGGATAIEAFDKAVLERGYPAFARGLFEAMFFDDKWSELSKQLVDRALSVPVTTAHALYRNMVRWDGDVADAAMAAVRVPVLVIQSTTRGAENVRRTLKQGETGSYEALVLKHIPSAEVVALPGLGHFVSYEAPREVNAAIDAFLDGENLR